MQELKTLAQTIRTEVQSIKNSGAGGDKNGSSESADSED